MINFPSFTLKYLFSFIVRLLGVYIILFVMCFYAHVNESNIIADRAGSLWDEVAREGPSRLAKVASIQQMVRKVKPNFFSPYTVFKSLLGERESFKLVNIQLADLIEKNKNGLTGISLVQVDVENADLSEADMHRVDLEGANLSRANLIAAKLNFANFHGARFLNTHVLKAVFSGAILKGADLGHVVELTCEQIESAVIDESTRLPDYISLAGSSESTFKCINFNKGKGVDLRRVNLAGTYLRNVDLRKSNLSRANFEKAVLSYTFLQKADLGHANLKGANLSFSYFKDANLTGTDLRGADLDRAKGLTCEQVKSALADKNTRLPSYISRECENSQGEKKSGGEVINFQNEKFIDCCNGELRPMRSGEAVGVIISC